MSRMTKVGVIIFIVTYLGEMFSDAVLRGVLNGRNGILPHNWDVINSLGLGLGVAVMLIGTKRDKL